MHFSEFLIETELGKYKPIKHTLNDEQVWLVAVNDPTSTGRTVHKTEELALGQAKFNVQHDKDNEHALKRETARKQQITDEQTKNDDTRGFTDDMTPIARARAIKTLNSLRRFNGVTDMLKNHLDNFAKEGRFIDDHNNLFNPKNKSMFIQKDITKIGMDYFKYITK